MQKCMNNAAGPKSRRVNGFDAVAIYAITEQTIRAVKHYNRCLTNMVLSQLEEGCLSPFGANLFKWRLCSAAVMA